ncbi:putative SP-containing membrane protein [Vairimorpha necatrix]|uniref:SP-containing membrane protein n=1 Tax=Vairimorpha necatrix TaxID=6039 RepID=A0AAX4JDC7_9MICR
MRSSLCCLKMLHLILPLVEGSNIRASTSESNHNNGVFFKSKDLNVLLSTNHVSTGRENAVSRDKSSKNGEKNDLNEGKKEPLHWLLEKSISVLAYSGNFICKVWPYLFGLNCVFRYFFTYREFDFTESLYSNSIALTFKFGKIIRITGIFVFLPCFALNLCFMGWLAIMKAAIKEERDRSTVIEKKNF